MYNEIFAIVRDRLKKLITGLLLKDPDYIFIIFFPMVDICKCHEV